MEKIKIVLPGLIVCTIISIISYLLGDLLPSLGAASFAIFIGIFLGNTMLKSEKYSEGCKFSETNLLAYSIVLIGTTLNIESIMAIKVNGILFIIIQMTLTIITAIVIGKIFGFNVKFISMMAAGNAVCGSSAIASLSDEINPEEKDKGISITVVNVVGTILMFILPLIAKILYSSSTIQSSALIGGILQSVGQVIASAKFMTDDIVNISTIFKIVRIIMIVVVVIVLGKYCKNNADNEYDNKDKKSKIKIPWFITAFFILCIINSTIGIPTYISKNFKWISSHFEVIALAGIGMRVKFKYIIKQGPKSMLYGLIIGGFQIIFAFILIKLLI